VLGRTGDDHVEAELEPEAVLQCDCWIAVLMGAWMVEFIVWK
jgi:hypothetical protein